MKETYIMKEIREFHCKNIPLEEYPNACRELRTKINAVANFAANIAKSNYLNNTITKDDYKFYMKIIEQQRRNYQRQVNSI